MIKFNQNSCKKQAFKEHKLLTFRLLIIIKDQLFMHSLAYILLHTMQKQILKGSEYANATMKTIQNKIIKTAAWVKELRTKIKIELPVSCTTKEVQIKGFERLLMLRT